MSHFYSDETREANPYSLPDAEAFHMAAADFLNDDGTWMAERMAEIVADLPDGLTDADTDAATREHAASLAGWYYWTCFPGCMPEGNPFGPYPSEAEAIAAAREQAGD